MLQRFWKPLRCESYLLKMETDSPEQEYHSANSLLLQGPAEVIADLRQMVNNSTYSDVEFICNDGKRVQALRKLVAGRSKVMKSLLLNGMAETGLSEIEMPKCSSRGMLTVLEFLYTGSLLDHQPQSWTIACELLLASRFFILPTLENIIRIFMHEQIFDVAEDKTKVASMFTEALGYGLCGEGDVFLAEVGRILSSDWSNSVFVQNLSEDALHYLLANSKGSCEFDGHLSLREYNRFMQVLLWWFYRGNLGPYAKENFMNFIREEDERALILFSNPDNLEIGSLFNASALCQLHGEPKNSVMRLLSNIDCRRIHPILLSKVVEPLNLVSVVDILSSFRFHALNIEHIRISGNYCERDHELDYDWDHAEFCTILQRGSVIKRAASRTGLAVMKHATLRSNMVSAFNFCIEQDCEDFIELGFFNYTSEVGAERPEFDDKRLSDQYDALVVKFQDLMMSVKLDGPPGQVNWKPFANCFSVEGFKRKDIVFRYNRSEDNCSLSIGTKDLGVIWKNLPKRLYYPAVSFGSSRFGRVCIDLL